MGVQGRSPWWVVVGAVLGLLVGNGPIMQFTIGVFIKPISQDMGWDRSTISAAIVVGLCLTGLVTPIAGRLIDRYGIHAVTLPAIVAFALLTASVALVPASPAMFIGLYALMGLAAAGQTPLPYAKAVASNFDSRRGLALGIAMAGVGLGAALIPQYARFLVESFGWRTAYFGLGALTLIVGFPAVALLVRESTTAGGRTVGSAAPGLTGGQALRTTVFWQMAAAFFLVAMAANGTIAHIVPLITDRGFTAQQATAALSAAGMALIAGRLVAGYLLDRIWAPYVSALFFLAPLVGLGILLTWTSSESAVIATILIGLGLGAEVDLIAYLISRYLGLRSFGEIYGYLFAIFMFGSGIGPYLTGVVFDYGKSYDPVLMLFAVALIIAAGVILRIGPYVYAAPRSPDHGRLETARS